MVISLKRLSTLISTVVVFSLALTSCGSNAGSSNQNSASNEQSTEAKKENTQIVAKKDPTTLVVANSADARTLDPHDAGDSGSGNALYPVFESLVNVDWKTGEILPGLAEKWEKLDDVSYKFYLRKGVKFHNGEEMKASDVVFSFKRAISPAGAKVAYIMKVVDPNGFEIIDDYTVVIKTLGAFSPFLGYMPYIGAVVMSEKAYSDPAAANHPIGTGPYMFVDWKKGDRLTYKKFNDYWGQKPEFENLIIRSIPDVNSRLIELETGNIDLAIGLTPNEVNRVKDNSKLQLFSSPSTIFTYLTYNCAKAPFDNVKFRQAIDYALDEEGINEAVYRGLAKYTPGPVTPDQKYFYNGEPTCRYDVEKAKQLLSESGVNVSGKKFALTVNDNQSRIDMAQIIQTQLKEIGIDVEIKVMETAAYFDFINGDEKEFFINGWGAVGFPEPDNNIYGPAHSSGIPSTNSEMYSNPTLDKLLDDSRATPDGEERQKIVYDIQKLLRDETPYITISNNINYIGAQNYVEGFTAQPTAYQIYSNIKIKK